MGRSESSDLRSIFIDIAELLGCRLLEVDEIGLVMNGPDESPMCYSLDRGSW